MSQNVASVVTRVQRSCPRTIDKGIRGAASRPVAPRRPRMHLGTVRAATQRGGLAARVSAHAVPMLPFARALAENGGVPGGSRRNLEYVTPHTHFDPSLSDADHVLLADAQTSGGLLIAVPPPRVDQLCEQLAAAGTLAHAVVGEVVAGPPGTIEVRP